MTTTWKLAQIAEATHQDSAVKGSFVHQGVKGANTLRFSGRLRSKRLPAGSYRLTATAKASGGRTASRTTAFRIARR